MYTTLVDENQTLRQEFSQLKEKLSNSQKLFNDLAAQHKQWLGV